MASNLMFSVVSPILNGAKTLDTCIQSVLKQENPKVEHLLVDGSSTDGTIEIIEKYSSQYPERVKLIPAPGTGPGEACNVGLKLAQGDVFSILGADDFLEEGAISTVADFLGTHPEAQFVHGHADFINEQGEIIGHCRADGFDYQDFVNTAKHIAITSAFYRRAVMEKIGWLDSSGDDFDVLCRIAREFQIYQVDRLLSQITLRKGSAFSPVDLKKRKELDLATFRVSRRYGGSLFSTLAKRYYRRVVFAWLHLDPLEPQYLAIRRWMGRSWKVLGR